MFQRLGKWILREDLRQIDNSLNILKEAYLDGPWIMPPSAVVDRLQAEGGPVTVGEGWSALQVDLLSQLGYVSGAAGSDYERTLVVQSSRRLWRYDVHTQWAIWLWTYYGFGRQINVTFTEPEDNETFDAFWEADENQPVLGVVALPQLSHRLLVDGEFGLMYFTSSLDGKTIIRLVMTDDIREIVYDQEDKAVPIFYKISLGDTVGEVYVADTLHRMLQNANGKEPAYEQLPEGAINGDSLRSYTIASMQLLTFNRKDMFSARGWPLATAGAPWLRTYKAFMEDRATLAAAIAQIAYKAKVKGGSRGVEAVRAKLDSILNPAGTGDGSYAPSRAAGGVHVENEAMDLQKLQFGTGASDAKADGEGLLTVASLGLGLFPHYMGAGDAFRLATATAMEMPLLRQWTAYQDFWSAQFGAVGRYVIWAKDSLGGKAAKTASVARTDISVTTDRLLDLDTAELATAVSSLVRDTIIPMVGIIPTETVQRLVASIWKMMFQSFGVPNADDLTSDIAFGVTEVAETERISELLRGHVPEEVLRQCPFPDCSGEVSLLYEGHKGLLVCATCNRTYDPMVE